MSDALTVSVRCDESMRWDTRTLMLESTFSSKKRGGARELWHANDLPGQGGPGYLITEEETQARDSGSHR